MSRRLSPRSPHPVSLRRTTLPLVIAACALTGCATAPNDSGTVNQATAEETRGSAGEDLSQTPGHSPTASSAAPPAEPPGDSRGDSPEARSLPRATDATDVPISSAALSEHTPVAPPVHVSYPDIDGEIPVIPQGVAADGQMDIPADASEAGWYRYGRAPGDDQGATVIAAHAGSVETPVGPLYGLHQARPGHVISVADESGEEHEYQVVQVEELTKDTLDLTPYFARDGDPTLVLITCGGAWNAAASSYDANIIVTATPVR